MITSRVCEHCGLCSSKMNHFRTKKGKKRANELTKHHILQKQFFGDNNEIVMLCKICHTKLHHELKKELNRIMRDLEAQTMYQVFAEWGERASRQFFRKFTNDFINSC